MWSRVHIVAVLFFCAVRLPAFAQQGSPPETSSDSYREHLKGISTDSASASSPSPDVDSRERYKQHLRSLAGVEINDTAPNQTSAPGDTAVSAKPDLKTLSNHPPERQVSLQRNDKASPTGMASEDPPAITKSSEGCRDAYCDHLRRVADGDLEIRSAKIESGRTLTTERNFIKNLAFDQMHIWTSPFRMKDSDATVAIPFGIVAGALVATDRDVSRQLAKPSEESISKQISDAGLYGSIAVGAGFYGLGLITGDEHKRETGLLAGEAFINSMLVAEALKVTFGRQRPFEGDHFGHIGRGGNSFPSGHAIGTWAIATVVAREYPSPLVQIGAYGVAATVAVTRVTGGQHFPSDVLLGSAFGYLIGRQVYKAHHNPELGGSEYGTFVREQTHDVERSGSAYVPLESWVYPAIDRLAALGLVRSNFDSERPFTRLECARLAQEAAERATDEDLPTDQQEMIEALQHEFSRENEVWAGDSANRSFQLESVYSRITQIAGPVLRDGYHFGQTLYNDYGRPYGRGFNNITGFSARATSGPMVFYFRGEYQSAPANPNYTPQQKVALQFLADDGTPQVDNAFPRSNRFRVLDAYLGVNFGNNLLTLGQQSLWWGPGSGGPLMFSNNAEPLKMIRLSRVSPVEVPLLSKFLGPLRYDMFVGQTDGYHYILTSQGLRGPNLGTQPFVQGQRITFKPTPNFEFGLTRTGVFGGTGYPLTANYFLRTTFSSANYDAGSTRKPGDRRSGFDVTYRIPKLRDRLTWYAEEFSEDEVSPIFFPRMSAMRSGVYAARLPGLPHVDLRVEGAYTDVPGYGAHGYFYSNATYKGGFTKNGNIMGNWIGREGWGLNAASTIWLSAKNSFQFGYRQGVASNAFAEGGRYHDELVKANFDLGRDLGVSATLQHENWMFPFLAKGLQTNLTSSVQITYQPSHSK